MIKCQVCGYDNKDEAKVCLNCGAVLEREKLSSAIDDVSEEQTVLLDPNAMQQRVQKDYEKERPVGEPPSAQGPPPPPSPGSMPPPPPPSFGGGPSSAQGPGGYAPGASPPPPPMGSHESGPPPLYNNPAAGMGMTGAGQPLNTGLWLGLSIAMTLCCCLPLGIAGIVFSVQAQSAEKTGNIYEAEEKIKKAKLMLLIGLIGGLIANALIIGLQVVAAMGSSGSYSSY